MPESWAFTECPARDHNPAEIDRFAMEPRASKSDPAATSVPIGISVAC